MKIYVSGKITGLPHLQTLNKFEDAAAKIRKAGHIVINPKILDGILPGLNWKAYMTIAYGVIHDPSIDAMYMLSDWAESKGAIVEWSWAKTKGLRIMYQDPRHRKIFETEKMEELARKICASLDGEKEQDVIMYLCDKRRKQCGGKIPSCQNMKMTDRFCEHTSDIRHAKNFKLTNGIYIEEKR